MQKKLVQSSLALTAAAALGLGSAFVASPALADGPQKLDVQNDAQVQKALSGIEGVNAYGAKGGELNLGVEKATPEMKDLEKKYDNVNFTEGIKELKAYAGNDVVGGAGYTAGEGSEPSGVCSTGFSGWDGDGNPVVLTAGHCSKIMDETTGAITGDSIVNDTELPSKAPANGSNESALSGIGVLGKWGFTSFGESGQHDTSEDPATAQSSDIDFAVINVDKSKYGVKNGVTDWKSAGSDDLSKSLATEITKVGAHKDGKIQKSGRTTGLTDGDVDTEYNAKFEFANVSGYFVHGFGVTSLESDPFSQPGDSGGAVFQGDTAVGVISGGGPTNDGSGEQFGWVADLDHSLVESGVNFQLTDPNEEPPGDDDANADADAKDADADAGADAKDADADAGADAKDADAAAAADADAKDAEASAAADGDDAKAEADADADAKDAEADAAADGKDADAAAAADGDDANANADADAKDAEADAAADGKDADAAAAADGDDANANADADAPEAPDAPVVDDQKVDESGQITGKTEANAKVELNWKPAATNGEQSAVAVQAAAQGSVTVTADAEGNFTAEAPSEAGTYDYTASATTDAGTSKATSFTVTVEAADEAPAERKISIEPKEVAASDFVKKDKGVQITVKGFEEGENVSLEVVAGPENVEGITLDETANEDGVAAFSIYGTNASDPLAYLGKYDVQVTGANDTDDEKALAGSFSVVADEDGNGGGSDDGNGDGGDGGSDLPRTGAELTGLAAGAGLLVVGGAAVVLTMRRNKKN